VNSRQKDVRCFLSQSEEEDHALLGEITLAGTGNEADRDKVVGDLTSPQIGIGSWQGSSPNFHLQGPSAALWSLFRRDTKLKKFGNVYPRFQKSVLVRKSNGASTMTLHKLPLS